jgi:hypothetical protein
VNNTRFADFLRNEKRVNAWGVLTSVLDIAEDTHYLAGLHRQSID